MTIQKSTKLADAVLSMVEFLSVDTLRLYAEPYQNGREHGWALSAFGDMTNKKAVFSEYRNTDEIVLYTGKGVDFSMQGNVPSDKAWGNKNFFSHNAVTECANYIVKYFSK
jgi:hypothetical protein